jgi:co-chaperonin GroES (HSP10)
MDEKDHMRIAAEFAHLQYKLFRNRVGVIRDDETEQIGSIILSDGIKKQSGTVVLVGEGVKSDPELTGVRIGDRILFNKYEPLLVSLPLIDGTEQPVVVMHAADLYVGWVEPGLEKVFNDEREKLGDLPF